MKDDDNWIRKPYSEYKRDLGTKDFIKNAKRLAKQGKMEEAKVNLNWAKEAAKRLELEGPPSRVGSTAKTIGKSISKKAASALPFIGPAIAALASADASAAMPIGAEDVGPDKDSLEYKFESGALMTPEEKMKLFGERQEPTEEQQESMEEKRRQQRLEALANISKSLM